MIDRLTILGVGNMVVGQIGAVLPWYPLSIYFEGISDQVLEPLFGVRGASACCAFDETRTSAHNQNI